MPYIAENSMKIGKDRFGMDIVLRHSAYRPEKISELLSIKPRVSWPAGQSGPAHHSQNRVTFMLA
jgi:hypothetical protein